MKKLTVQVCERCEGTGADPMLSLYEVEVQPCSECRGDGYVAMVDFVEEARLSA
jgi:DnaJ-class molecular chaperone